MTASKTSKTYPSAIAVERAVDLLFLLAEREEASVSELAGAIGSSSSAVHRILTALRRKGLVEQRRSKERYALAWRILALAHSVRERADLRALSLSSMVELRDLTGETVTLNVRSGFERSCIEQVEGVHEIRWRSEIGRVSPLYAGATGRALLAHLPSAQLERYLATVELRPLTPRTITDRRELERELARIRRQGLAAARDDRIPGVAGSSAPIFDESGAADAALTIAGPSSRLTSARLASFAGPLTAAARRISALSGYHPPT